MMVPLGPQNIKYLTPADGKSSKCVVARGGWKMGQGGRWFNLIQKMDDG